MTQQDLMDRQRDLSECLGDMCSAIPSRNRAKLLREMSVIETAAKQGLAALFLLDWLWSITDHRFVTGHPNADQVDKLLRETRADSVEER